MAKNRFIDVTVTPHRGRPIVLRARSTTQASRLAASIDTEFCDCEILVTELRNAGDRVLFDSKSVKRLLSNVSGLSLRMSRLRAALENGGIGRVAHSWLNAPPSAGDLRQQHDFAAEGPCSHVVH
jgi:hypothetical protein